MSVLVWRLGKSKLLLPTRIKDQRSSSALGYLHFGDLSWVGKNTVVHLVHSVQAQLRSKKLLVRRTMNSRMSSREALRERAHGHSPMETLRRASGRALAWVEQREPI